ncbi:hypothetical protein RHGRI_038014 [Rhododendron griersonianum]|uniref:Uncharacterized protein n=1 Tax=Rhododendron griersonianum TaxID=479676 RepID=A0AAV6HXB9_9ERIC|nr:hypothetical protein RHGRI_038014 [Rhododendron griersonianum]
MEVRVKILFNTLCHTDIYFWEATCECLCFPEQDAIKSATADIPYRPQKEACHFDLGISTCSNVEFSGLDIGWGQGMNPLLPRILGHEAGGYEAGGRALGDASSAITYFEESVNFLKKVPTDDLEIIHTLYVSLNKVRDLKYYDEDLQGARSYYFQSLNVRRDAIKNHPSSPSQVSSNSLDSYNMTLVYLDFSSLRKNYTK